MQIVCRPRARSRPESAFDARLTVTFSRHMAPAAALAVLSLPWYATDHDRKTAYRQLALRHHPDRSSHPKAKETFQRLQQANEVLQRWFAEQAIRPSGQATAAASASGSDTTMPPPDWWAQRSRFFDEIRSQRLKSVASKVESELRFIGEMEKEHSSRLAAQGSFLSATNLL